MFLWLRRIWKKKEKSAEEITDYVHQTKIPMLIEELVIKSMLYGEKSYLGRYTSEDYNHLVDMENELFQIMCKLYKGSPEFKELCPLIKDNIIELFFWFGYKHGYSASDEIKEESGNYREADNAIKTLYEKINIFISRLRKLEHNWKELLETDDNIYQVKNGMVVLAEKTPNNPVPKVKDKSKDKDYGVRMKAKITKRRRG